MPSFGVTGSLQYGQFTIGRFFAGMFESVDIAISSEPNNTQMGNVML